MSCQREIIHQQTDMLAIDWCQVPDKDLEIETDDSEVTKQDKEAKRTQWEAEKKLCQVEAGWQKAGGTQQQATNWEKWAQAQKRVAQMWAVLKGVDKEAEQHESVKAKSEVEGLRSEE
ncbi:hypothetical protein EDC04DRAFT_2914805 [Pisolithus marmoratus]|nr:hypothetical protein EDC04DRAFT_2914805 [Pisolithus marmoratus]